MDGMAETVTPSLTQIHLAKMVLKMNREQGISAATLAGRACVPRDLSWALAARTKLTSSTECTASARAPIRRGSRQLTVETSDTRLLRGCPSAVRGDLRALDRAAREGKYTEEMEMGELALVGAEAQNSHLASQD